MLLFPMSSSIRGYQQGLEQFLCAKWIRSWLKSVRTGRASGGLSSDTVVIITQHFDFFSELLVGKAAANLKRRVTGAIGDNISPIFPREFSHTRALLVQLELNIVRS